MPEPSAGEGRGPRPFWSGAITFGLVSVPVRLFAATRPSGPSLRMVAEDGVPLTQEYVCPEDARAVSRDEIVRGHETDDGRWVIVTREELEALEPDKSREIDLRQFVPLSQLDPVFFDRPYLLVPDEGASKAYRLLATVMEDEGLAGVATFVMRGREYLVAILSIDGLLRAETMRFHDEIRTPDIVGLPELAEAPGHAVSALVGAIEKLERDTLDLDEMEDGRAEAIEKLVDEKRKGGEEVALPAEVRAGDPGGGRVIDLVEALKKSLEAGE